MLGGMERIGIIGGGAWGTALGQILARSGRTVTVWAHEAATVAAIERRENTLYLPGVALDPRLAATGDLAAAAACEALLLVVPAQHLRAVAARLAPVLPPKVPVVICTKGIEASTGALMTELVAETIAAAPRAVLSGPTFAAEVARGLPTAVTLATEDAALGQARIAALGSRTFRPYLSDDPVGAEIGGAIKNVLAIACGVVMGRGLGENARAAVITRGLAEMVRLAQAKGGRAVTLMGLSGLGDLVLTCTGAQSRNYSLGVAIGQGQSLAAIERERRSIAEGVMSAPAAVALAARVGVELPIAAAVDAILHRGAAIDGVIETLLTRPFRAENYASDRKS
jgi:glycerol-3-phosphate dehydrogenase (NAD(P)+)